MRFLVLALLTFRLAMAEPGSYAIYAEYARDGNKLMQNGLNRRLFNKVEAQRGTDIQLNSDGSITLQPGTYRITGFSMVSMQTTFAPAVLKNNNYPGYSMVYPAELEGQRSVVSQAIIGSPATSEGMSPSTFDAIYTTDKPVRLAVGHQAGDDLHGEVYLSVYDVEGAKSDFHLAARIAITKL